MHRQQTGRSTYWPQTAGGRATAFSPLGTGAELSGALSCRCSPWNKSLSLCQHLRLRHTCGRTEGLPSNPRTGDWVQTRPSPLSFIQMLGKTRQALAMKAVDSSCSRATRSFFSPHTKSWLDFFPPCIKIIWRVLATFWSL